MCVRAAVWLMCVLILGTAAGAASASADSFSWSAPIALDRSGGTHNNLTALSCPMAAQCTAGDINGEQVTFNPTSPGSPNPTTLEPGSDIAGMACVTASECTAIDTTDEITFNPTSPGDPKPVSIDAGGGLRSVACPSATQCTAVGGAGHEVTFDPSSPAAAVPVRIPRDSELDAVDCPSTGECITVDLTGYGYVGSAPSSVGGPPPPTSAPAPISATTRAATERKTTSSVLHGLVGTNGTALTWQFQFGTSRSYNKGTPMQAIPTGQGQGQVPVSWKLKNLRPNTVYHFRLTAASGGNLTASGADRTFRTKPNGKLVLAFSKLKVVGRFVSVSLRCSSQLPCRGRFSVTTRAKVGKRHKLGTVGCATTFYKLRPHQHKRMKARVSAVCASLLRDARGHHIRAKFTSRLRTGQLGVVRRIRLSL